MNNRTIGILSGAAIATLAFLLIAAAPTAPNSLKYQSFTTNATGMFPALLPTTPSFMRPVGSIDLDGTVYESPAFGFNSTILVWTNNYYLTTNALPVGNMIDVSKAAQSTNCSADPTFSSIRGVTNGLGFGTVVDIQANGANRTLSITAPNVHVYPSGTLIITNGSFGLLSVGGIGGTYTGAVFLAFP